MKVSDYIAQKLVDEGITDAFMVTGGGAMHLDDGLDISRDFTAILTTMNRHAPSLRRRMRESTTRSRLSA